MPYGNYGSTPPQDVRGVLFRLMLLQMMQDQMQGGTVRPPQPSAVDRIFGTIDKGRSLYNTGNDIYQGVSGDSQSLGSLFNKFLGGSSGAITPLSQQLYNATASAAPSLTSSFSATPSSLNQVIPLFDANGVVANEAANAAYNSAGEQATNAALAGKEGALGTLGSVAQGLGGLYAMYKGGDMVLDANKVGGAQGRAGGALGGGTAALGTGMALNALGFALGPVGWAALIGAGLAGGTLGGWRLGDKDMWKTEGKRLTKLLDNGVEIPDSLQGPRFLTHGRKLKEFINPNLPNDFMGYTPQYGFVNNKWATTRDEKYLRPEDIWGYSAFFEKYGNDWLKKFSEQQRRDIAQKALDAGAVDEHHGTIDIKWTPELESSIGTPSDTVTQPTTRPLAPRPKAGSVSRLSPGLYRNEFGELQQGNRIPRARRQ